MNLYYVHINEDGEWVNVYESPEQAAWVLSEFPMDRIEVRLHNEPDEDERARVFRATLNIMVEAAIAEEAQDRAQDWLIENAGHIEFEISEL